MKRIAIIGPSGAGKSTLARMLGEKTGLPVCHIDALHWQPGWVESTREETYRKVAQVVAEEEWITDGNYSTSFDVRMARADTVIFLDFPRRIYMGRVIKRTLRYYGLTRPDLGEGCPERFDREFLLWVWNFHKRARPRLIDALVQYRGNFVLHHLHSPAQVKDFLARIPQKELAVNR